MILRLGIALVLYIAATYFMCGVPFGKLIARFGANIDIQKVGSGNIGTTNVARSLGVGPAAITLALDAGKAFLCCFLARPIMSYVVFGGDSSPLAFGAPYDWVLGLIVLTALSGHVFSPYMRFRGGKGVAVGLGATLGMCWPVALGLLVVWLIVVIPTRIVSAASCAAALALPFLCWFLLSPSMLFTLCMALAGFFVIWAHRSNLQKLIRGEEAPFSFHRKDTDSQGE